MASQTAEVIGLIEQNITERPENQQEIAKTLLALLKIPEKRERYVKICLFSIASLEEFLDGEMGQKKKEGDKLTVNFPTLEKIAVAAVKFSLLNEKETEQVEKYLLSLISKVVDSLEHHLAENLNAESKPRYLIAHPRALNSYTTILSVLNSQYYEDFCLLLSSPVTDDQIAKLAANYYQKRGFEMRKLFPDPSTLIFMAQKDREVHCINITPMDTKILVTVMREFF